MHQGAWLAWTAGAGVVAATSTNPIYLGIVLAAAWAVHASHGRSGFGVRPFRFFLIFGLLAVFTRTALVGFAPGSADATSFALAAAEGSRLAVILCVFGAFNSVGNPYGLLKLAPRRWHEPALAAALALSIAPRMIAAAGAVKEAHVIRGIPTKGFRSLPSMAVPVLTTGMENAMTLAESMDARGHGSGRRSTYRNERWTGPAVIVVLASGLAAAVFLILAVTEDATLSLAFPLGELDAALAGVSAATLIALPICFSSATDG